MDFSQRSGSFDNPTSLVHPKKFDTAIRDSFSVSFYKGLADTAFQTKDHKLLLDSAYTTDDPFQWSQTPEHYGILIRNMIREYRPLHNSHHFNKMLSTVEGIVNKIVLIQLGYAHSQNLTHTKGVILNAFQRKSSEQSIPVLIRNLLFITQQLSEIITKSNLMYDRKYSNLGDEEYIQEICKINHAVIPSINLTFVWSNQLIYLRIDDDEYLQPKSVLLMYHNKICDLCSILMLVYFGTGSIYDIGDYHNTVNFVSCLCQLLINKKDKYFHIVKVLEGLGIAETLYETEDWTNNEFLHCMADDLVSKANFYYIGSSLQLHLQNASIPMRHELMCLSKLLGHPLVSMEEGSKSLYKKTHISTPIDLSQVIMCVNFFKKEYIKKHISKFKKWPPCTLDSMTAPKPLVMSYIYNKDPDSFFIKSKFGIVDIKDYIFINLEKNMEFHKLENIIPHLKDKTISLLKTPVIQRYLQGLNIEQGWKDTRLLLAYLLNPTMVHNHVEYLNKYSTSTDFGQLLNYLVIRIVPKEKELKIDYRGFGCKTYEDRYRSLAQEKNVMRYLDEFSDEQAMTLSELSLLKKLDAFRRIKTAYKEHTVLYIVVDSSAWNNRFRKETVDYMMEETLDKVFDYEIFSKTHKAFENTLVYIPDHLKCYYWEGQAGGIEGLNQDTWVVCYLSQIKVALHQFDFKYHVLCKGDDLRIAVMIPNISLAGADLRQVKNDIVVRISKTASDFGHQINIEESYGSSKYLAFSKSSSIERVELPQSFRKIQKCYGANNAFINTLDDYIASTFSNAHSACKVSPIVLPCYLVGLFWATYYLKVSSLYGNLPDSSLVGLLLTPSLLGGFPIIYLHNMPIRAESDLLSPFIGLYQYCREYFYDISIVMEGFLTIPVEEPNSFVGLFKDPYSLPSSRPPLASNVLRSYISPALRYLTKNRDLKQLFRAACSDENNLALEILNSATILRAKILATLYSATPTGILEELVRKFESGQSILELLILRHKKGAATRILRRVLKADMRVNIWRIERLKGHHTMKEQILIPYIVRCPAKSAAKIREFAWKKPVEDVTMPPMQHQMIFTYAAHDTFDEWANKNHFLYFFSSPTTNHGVNSTEHFSTGDDIPFVGYTTRTGMVSPTIHFIEKDAILKKAKNLLDMITWTNTTIYDKDGNEITSNARSVIKGLLTTFTDIPLDTLAPFAGIRKSGTSQHHMRSPNFRESIVPNVLSNTYTRFKGESNTHVNLRLSTHHFRMNFLHCYCWTNWIGFSELEVTSCITTPEMIWGITVQCDFCNTPIPEQPLIFTHPEIDSMYFQTLRITNIGEVSEDILMKSLEEYVKKAPNLRSEQTALDFASATRGLMQELSDTTYHETETLVNRYTQHAVSSEAAHVLSVLSGSDKNRYVGLTEIKCMSLEGAIEYLQLMVINTIPFHCHPLTKNSIENWLMSIPSSSIPWTGILRMFYEAGRLEELIRVVVNSTQMAAPGCYYSPDAAARYLGLATIVLLDRVSFLEDIIVLSYYNTGMLSRHVLYVGTIIKSKVVRSCTEGVSFSFQGTEEVVKPLKIRACMSILRAFILYSCCRLEEDIILELCSSIEKEGVGSIDYCDLTLVDEEIMYAFLDDIENGLVTDRQIIYLYMKLSDITKGLRMTMEEVIDNGFDAVMNVLQTTTIKSKVNIVYTSIDECIKVVRANRLHDEDTLDGSTSSENKVDQLYLNNDSLRRVCILDRLPTIRMNLIGCDYYPPLVSSPFINPIDAITSDQFQIRPQYMYRVVGSANPSPNVLLEMLHSLSLASVKEFPNNVAILCMCDGLGGFLSVFNLLTSNSYLVFHTIPKELRVETHPSLALPATNSNCIAYHFLNEGYSNILLQSTRDRILKLCKMYYIQTSDLEYMGESSGEYLELQSCLIDLFLTSKHKEGIIFMRIDGRFASENLQLIDILLEYTENVIVYQPRSETYKYGMYVICMGYRKNYDHSILITKPNRLINSITARHYVQFIRRLSGKLLKENRQSNPFYSFVNPNLSYLTITIRDTLGLYGLTEFTRQIGVTITEDQLAVSYTRLADAKDHSALIRAGLNVSGRIKYLTKMLNNTDSIIHSRTQSHDTDIQAHRRVLLTQLFLCEGFAYTSSLYKGPKHEFKINQVGCVNRINVLYQSLHIRDKTRLDWDALGANEIPHWETDDYLVKSFFSGANIFLSAVSSFYLIK